ncbi:periplasmic heavy metal sensor [bacterium]|nr:periplasmic heavy metal sensor [bacterium]
MKRWMQIALVMSLAFNFGFLGAFVYRMLEKSPRAEMAIPDLERPVQPVREQPRQPTHKPVLQAEQKRALFQIRQQFQPQIREIRQTLLLEKRVLGDMLIQGDADSIQIVSQINTIGDLEVSIEKAVIFELIRESRILNPEDRAAFIRTALLRLEGIQNHPQKFQNRPNIQGNRSRLHPENQQQRRNRP